MELVSIDVFLLTVIIVMLPVESSESTSNRFATRFDNSVYGCPKKVENALIGGQSFVRNGLGQ